MESMKIETCHMQSTTERDIINNRGPTIEPCGIPLITAAQFEKVSLTRTLCFLFAKKHSIQPIKFLCMP